MRISDSLTVIGSLHQMCLGLQIYIGHLATDLHADNHCHTRSRLIQPHLGHEPQAYVLQAHLHPYLPGSQERGSRRTPGARTADGPANRRSLLRSTAREERPLRSLRRGRRRHRRAERLLLLFDAVPARRQPRFQFDFQFADHGRLAPELEAVF